MSVEEDTEEEFWQEDENFAEEDEDLLLDGDL